MCEDGQVKTATPEMNEREVGMGVNATHLERSSVEGAPTLWGTPKYDELWAKASQVNPELSDDAAVEEVVEKDATLVLDVEELD